MTQKFVYSIFWCSLFSNRQKILLSRWLQPKLISTLKFLSNCKTMFWVISQEQHSIKTLEFTETNSYFYSFTYEKNIFSSSSHQCVVFLRICWQTEKLWSQYQNIFCLLEIQTRLLFFSLRKNKWVNSIDWSINREKYVFHLDKWNFELIGYSAHNTDILALVKALLT